ncbi:MAG: hypothetical protein IJZ95_05180 [Oscillospiraceae bacterium]|nr:hypothetical protein [Oscillospiraceae bacterium]
MVWNSETSTLYQAVERHNAKAQQPLPPENEAGRKKAECQRKREPKRNTLNCDPFSSLFNDRDSLLIAAVILILLHEKADTKLILALAFVLFS